MGLVLALLAASCGGDGEPDAGGLVGGRLELLSAQADSPERAVRAARTLRRRGALAIVGGFDEPSLSAVA